MSITWRKGTTEAEEEADDWLAEWRQYEDEKKMQQVEEHKKWQREGKRAEAETE